jgi:hypothetical protein
MKFVNCILLAALLVCLPTLVNAQIAATQRAQTPPPGNIKLLPGYVHEARRGIDSRVGIIYKKDGLSIGYDIGRMAGVYAEEYFPENFERLRKQTHLNPDAIEREIHLYQDKVEWRQRQKLNGDEVMIVYLKDSTLLASFVNSTANFSAKVDSADKIADFFLTVLTYQPINEKKD